MIKVLSQEVVSVLVDHNKNSQNTIIAFVYLRASDLLPGLGPAFWEDRAETSSIYQESFQQMTTLSLLSRGLGELVTLVATSLSRLFVTCDGREAAYHFDCFLVVMLHLSKIWKGNPLLWTIVLNSNKCFGFFLQASVPKVTF